MIFSQKDKNNEASFRELAKFIREVLYIVSPDWKIFYYVNPAYEEVWQKSRESLYQNPNSWVESIHPEDYQSVVDYIEKKAQGDLTDIVFPEFRVVRPDGTYRWIVARGYVITGESGGVVRIAGIAADVTERKLAEEREEQLQRQLQQAQKMESIGHLTGGIAHDFNNILASISGFSELAKLDIAQQKEDKLLYYLDQISRSSGRAADLVTQMLIFSRKLPGRYELIASDLSVLLRDMIKMLRPVLTSSMDIKFKCDGEIPIVLVNPVGIQQLVMNLCLNARDASQGNGAININLKQVDVSRSVCNSCHANFGGEFVELCIADSGPGIDSGILRNIFEPFFTTKEVGEGTGMGLAVVHGIVHEHGGHVVVNSRPEKGTEFHLYFRIKEGLQPKESKIETVSRLVDGSELYALVVDDELQVSLFLSEALKLSGFKVDAMTDSRKALNEFKSYPDKYHLVITDQTMDGMSGLQISKEMLEIRPDLPIILCTGYSDSVDEDIAQKAGIKKFLMKPVLLDDLKLAISEIV